MKVVRTTHELQRWRASQCPETKIAFVPTMGYLHEGHLSLLREARVRAASGQVVLSIFVNPSQFAPGEDFESYPRDEAADLHKAQSEGVDLAFCPLNPSEMYPVGPTTWVQVEQLDQYLCGATRPDHFRGVCTIVAKLWNLLRPDFAFFGEKDIQQLTIIRRMHQELFLSGEIVGMPILRESDGLAMSSRNVRLSNENRVAARRINEVLQRVAERFRQGERSVANLLGDVKESLLPGRVDYLEIVDGQELQPVEVCKEQDICAMAAFYGGVRLIDNVCLK